MDLRFSNRTEQIVERTRTFVHAIVLDIEDRFSGVAQDDSWRLDLQERAREAKVFGPHLSPAVGGLGLNMVERGPVFEEAGFSLFGAMAINAASPDEGNQHLLSKVANDEQQETYLVPLAKGEVRSAFAMTEPAPGAGSDPRALRSVAERTPRGWRIHGVKQFITGANGAAFFVVMARTSGQPGDKGGATMFLVDSDNPGLSITGHIRTMDASMIGGHCIVRLTECRVPDSAVLGEVDRGFEYANVRLGPARLTHCMRWLGAARRAHEIAVVAAATRQAFGRRISDLGMAQQMIADSEIDFAASRGLILRGCWECDQGIDASESSSIAKTFVSEAVGRIVDRSLQLLGGSGMAEDLPLARIFRETRPFRIYDGPSEVHRWMLATRATKRIVAAAMPSS